MSVRDDKGLSRSAAITAMPPSWRMQRLGWRPHSARRNERRSRVLILRAFFRLADDCVGRDRGKELADHQRLTLATNVEVYFCDPRSPWQRGSSENTNRLLRQYLPRGTDLSVHSQAKLSAIARQLNERPRKTLLYQTPAEKFAGCVAAIG